MLTDAATQPLPRRALKDAVAGSGMEAETALTDAATLLILAAGLGEYRSRDLSPGGARDLEPPLVKVPSVLTGWQAVTAALSDYASGAREVGGDIGQSLVYRLPVGQDAVGGVREDRQLNFRDLVSIADRRSGETGGASSSVHCQRALGRARRRGRYFRPASCTRAAWSDRPAPALVPAMAFAAAPRMHSGGAVGPSARRGARDPAAGRARALAPRAAATARAAGSNISIMARDAESFRQSQAWVAADIARAVSLGRRM